LDTIELGVCPTLAPELELGGDELGEQALERDVDGSANELAQVVTVRLERGLDGRRDRRLELGLRHGRIMPPATARVSAVSAHPRRTVLRDGATGSTRIGRKRKRSNWRSSLD
jgi:hypothetical protein